MTKKGKTAICDVCHKPIKTKTFRWLMVHKVTYKDKYFHESAADCEIDMDVCEDCIQNLNFNKALARKRNK